MRKWFPIAVLILLFALVAMVVWISNQLDFKAPLKSKVPPVTVRAKPIPARPPTAGESLLEGYGDPASPPLEDLKKIHRVGVGYFSVIKESGRFPIGCNADFSAALQGVNPNREVFVPRGHRVFSADGILLDRWGSPLIVHPEAWRELELRSAGPDRIPYNDDDLILSPAGVPISSSPTR